MLNSISPHDPDLEALAQRFANQAASDPDAALQLWSTETARIDSRLRAAAGRLAEQRMDWRARAALSTRRSGASLLMQWKADRWLHPAVLHLPILSSRLTYAYCAGLVLQRGSRGAVQAMNQGRMVLLGLRRDTSTLSNRGRGVYDDYIVVLNGGGGLRSSRVFPACTEPGAQYSHRAKPIAGGRVDPRYDKVVFKKIEGADVDGDGITDAGRLLAGSYFYREKPKGYMDDRAFESTRTQTAERDTDGDGRFTWADRSRLDAKNVHTSMYIHRGGTRANGNTWSAGCQTIPDDLYPRFLASLGPMKSFYYLLIDGH